MTQEELEKYVGLDFYNQNLKEAGVSARIYVGDDGDGGYEMCVKDGEHTTGISCGLNEDELADEVITCYYEIVRKIYVVTFVQLSDEEPDDNGYCKVKVCAERHIAERVLKEWLADEITEHDEPKVFNSDGKSIISWNCGLQKVIISIHETRKEWV